MSSVTLRNAAKTDVPVIARLFDMASEGVSKYIWSSLQDEYPGMELIEIGEARYGRENTDFCYQNCIMAEDESGDILGMVHCYVMQGDGSVDEDFDPVLRPYAEMEEQGSLYITSFCVFPKHRNRGIGGRLMEAVLDRAREKGCPSLSLIAFEANAAGIRLYKRLGFVETMRRAIVAHPMIEPEGDALLFVKKLT